MLPRRPLLAAALAALVAATALPAAQAVGGAQVTLRVAPTFSQQADPATGYVIPSEHPFSAAAEPILEGLTGRDAPATTTPAVWLRDPAADDRFDDETGVAGCTLVATDADGSGAVTGAEVLTQAEDAGCITGWDTTLAFGDPFVTSVDGLEKSDAPGADPATGYPHGWWQIQENGHVAGDGIASLTLDDGDDLGLVYMRHG